MNLNSIRPDLFQKPHAAQVDFSNPIVRGLVFDWDAADGTTLDAVNRTFGEGYKSGATRTAGPHGIEVDLSGSQANRSVSFGGAFNLLNAATEATYDIMVRFDEVVASPHFFGQWDSAQCWLLQRSGTGLVWVAADDNSGNRRRWDGSGLFPSAGYYHITASWMGGANKFLLINRVDKTSGLSAISTAATQIGSNAGSDYLQLGIVNGGTALNGGVVFARIWNRALTADECWALQRRPRQTRLSPRALIMPSAGLTFNTAWAANSNSVWTQGRAA